MENQKFEVIKLGKEATEVGIMLGWKACEHGHSLDETLEAFRKIWNGKQEEGRRDAIYGKRN